MNRDAQAIRIIPVWIWALIAMDFSLVGGATILEMREVLHAYVYQTSPDNLCFLSSTGGILSAVAQALAPAMFRSCVVFFLVVLARVVPKIADISISHWVPRDLGRITVFPCLVATATFVSTVALVTHWPG